MGLTELGLSVEQTRPFWHACRPATLKPTTVAPSMAARHEAITDLNARITALTTRRDELTARLGQAAERMFCSHP